MKNNEDYIEYLSEKLTSVTKWIIDHRLWVIAVCIVLSACSIMVSLNLKIDNSIEAYFNLDDPSYVEYDKFMDEYGNDEFIYILYTTKQGIGSLESLKKTKALAGELEEIPFVKKINAITNIEFIESDESGGLIIYDLMEDFPVDQKQADALIAKLLDKPLYVNGYITKDKKYAAILCEMEDKPKDDPNYHMKIGGALKKVLANPLYKDFEFWPIGNPVLNSEFYFIFEKESQTRPILTYFIMIVILIWFFRQVKGVVGPLAVVVISLIFVFGFVGIMKLPVTAMFAATPSLLISIGVAASVHFINEYRNFIREGNDNRTSILLSVKMVGVPILFTSLTTIAGFASLITSPMSATRDFGWYTVFGTSANMICCFTVLFIVLSYAGKRTEKAFYLNIKDRNKGEKKDHRLMEKMMEKIAGINKRHYKAVLIISGIITVISVWGIAKLEFNSSYLEEYGDRVKIYHDYKFIDKITGVSDNFEILLNSNKQDGVKTLEFVRALEKIQKFADSKNALVGKTVSVVDIIKDINRSFHGNDIAYYKLPDSDEEVSQYILLYESSGGEELEKLVSADVATARLTIYIKSSDSKTSLVFYNELVQYIDSIIPSGYSYNITGISYLVLKAMKYIEDTQVSSLFTATVIISLLMVIIFRSFKIGIISMLPNLFPIIVTLGIMGWAGIWLDYVRTLISCIAIGIAVDDTIHFIARYHTEFNRESNYEKALYATIRYVGSAVTISSGVLIIGFSVSMTSVLNDSFYFGMLSSICLLIGLIAEHFVTPSLILAFKPFGNEFNTQG